MIVPARAPSPPPSPPDVEEDNEVELQVDAEDLTAEQIANQEINNLADEWALACDLFTHKWEVERDAFDPPPAESFTSGVSRFGAFGRECLQRSDLVARYCIREQMRTGDFQSGNLASPHLDLHEG